MKWLMLGWVVIAGPFTQQEGPKMVEIEFATEALCHEAAEHYDEVFGPPYPVGWDIVRKEWRMVFGEYTCVQVAE